MAKNVFDIMLDESGDIAIKNGDLVVGESSAQHQRLLLLCSPGDIMSAPLVGVGLMSYTNDDANADELTKNIQKQFEADGMRVKKITGDAIDELIINAEYK